MKTIATLRTYDSNDLTSVGYDVTIRNNGTMKLEKRSRWQNSMSGAVYIVDTPASVQAAIDATEDEDQPDIETAFAEWMLDEYHENWRKVRNGYKVQ